MLSFKIITLDFFKFLNIKILECFSEQEAKEAALNINENSSYPVYFFKSETSGEKLYEEFYSDTDVLNLNKFKSIGVITNSERPDISEVNFIINHLISSFDNKKYDKSKLITSMNRIIPNFKHIETGKSLDQKM